MKKLITISAILLSLLSFAQDTLMTFDFTDGKYDSTIFTNLNDFKPIIDSSRSDDIRLVLISPKGELGPFNIEITLDTSFNIIYDSITIEQISSGISFKGATSNSPKTMSYTRSFPYDPFNPDRFEPLVEYEMYHSIISWNTLWDFKKKACTDCKELQTLSTSYWHFNDITVSPKLDRNDIRIYSSDYKNVFHDWRGGTSDHKYHTIQNSNASTEALKDFCSLVATDIGSKDIDWSVFHDCETQNSSKIFSRYDFNLNHALRKIHIIGYKSNITSTDETINSNNTKEPIKYLNTQGIEIKKENLQPNTLYISIYEDGKREKFMIVK